MPSTLSNVETIDQSVNSSITPPNSCSKGKTDQIKKLVAALPQVYQPIFGHPDFSCNSLRNCEDRLEKILAVHDALVLQLKRPVRVLDLGCAQGWFGLSLAKRGAQVIGIDFLSENVQLCNYLTQENPELKIRFSQMEIERLPSQLKADQFDLVLGLSVFHQLCYRNGKKWTRDLLGLIYEHIPVALIETALYTEPGGFGDAQPKNPDFFVDQMPFFRVLASHSRYFLHSRPLYFASSRYWYLGGKMNSFTSWHNNGRGKQFFFGESLVAKVYNLSGPNGPDSRDSFIRESQLLANASKKSRLPALLGHEESNDSAWLVREKIPGTPLGEMLHKKLPYNEQTVLKDVLFQLSEFEQCGLIHGEIGIWNVVIGADSHARIIGYDDISGSKKEGESNVSLFSAFLFFMRQVVRHEQFENAPVRSPIVSPLNLAEPHRGYVQELLKRPVALWTFQFLYDVFQSSIPEACTPSENISHHSA